MKKGISVIMCAAFLTGSGVSANDDDFESQFERGDNEYAQMIRADLVAKTPEWNVDSGKPCPLPLSKGIASARAALDKLFPNTPKWVVYEFDVCSVGGEKHWYYDIYFKSSDPDSDDEVSVVVLLDGSVPPLKKK